jgi:hypothetical protein
MTTRIAVTRSGAVKRAREVDGIKPSRYKLGAGGRNPAAPTPFTIRDKILGSDCIGFVLWCLGLDRFQKDFPHYGGWINTDSAIQDAKTTKKFFTQVHYPEPGDLVIYPALYEDGKRVRIGHVGMVVEVPADWPSPEGWPNLSKKEKTSHLKRVKVIDCAGTKWRRLMGDAVRETTAAASWDKPDAIFARYNHFVPNTVEAILAHGKVLA